METVFISKYFKSFLSASGREYQIDFGYKKVNFSFCQLLALRHSVNQMSAQKHLEELLNTANVDILSLCNKEHFIILDIAQILDLHNLIDQMFGCYVSQPKLAYSN